MNEDVKPLNKVFLTFDVEDFINPASIKALESLLEMLKKHNLKALFFITGHMAERLSNSPDIIDMLKTHEISYHSSSHSVRPTIFEYTDIQDYDQAYEISLKRETSHVNPLTGEIKGKGGITYLKELFSNKKIIAYRAPGCCWSAPHLEALRELGIQFDFSSNISSKPLYHKGITFYPYPNLGDWGGSRTEYLIVFRSILTRQHTVIDVHPNHLVYKNMWDYIYYHGNPKELYQATPRNPKAIRFLFNSFELLLRQLRTFQNLKLIEVTSNLAKHEKNVNKEQIDFEKVYENSVLWAKRYFKYEPKFLHQHFLKFFDLPNAY